MAKQFVLYDDSAKIFAGHESGKIVAVESISSAVHFEHGKDNPDMKCRFYNSITGANFRVMNI